MNFFEMLIMSKRMSFEDGTVTLYGENVLIIPAPNIVKYICMAGANQGNGRDMYSRAKAATLEYKQDLVKAYKSGGGMSWIINTINLYGLGKATYQGASNSLPAGVIILENSPFAHNPDCKAGAPIDHVLRGIIAGMASAIFNKDFDTIELKCAAAGGDSCKIIIDSKKNLMRNFPQFYEDQI
ncbi:MAG: 4-vinyl reductase [Candidatus Micrarchaeota archaeon]|nr:4-vinyl reductase [Candidatus Micrarchaeota archaeon]MDE1849100.1 4-vinyl reductase [Candidatus Micrarchaeota archaeon]